MIVAPHDDALVVITQNDHAHLAAELLSLWRRDDLAEHPRRRELLLAVREHDNGWQEADSAPHSCPETGRPLDFLAVPPDLRRAIWRRGTARLAEREPYAAALIVRHAIQLHRAQGHDPEWAALLDEWRELGDGLLEVSGVEPEVHGRDYLWLELADLLSLGLCSRWHRELELHGYRGEVRGDVLVLDPFPLAGATTFRVPCRRIPDRRYAGDADLGTELAAARWREYAVRVVPADAQSRA